MNGLFGSTVLDVAVGLVFVYLLLAIMCTSLNEWISGVLNLRGRNLAMAIRQLLDRQPTSRNPQPDSLIEAFYNHPLISGMMKSSQHPSYIPARTFASTLMDLVTQDKQGSFKIEDIQAGINGLPDGDVKRTLNALLRTANSDVAQAQKNIETWFNDTMDQVSGWYKRKVQLMTAVIALLLAVGMNADTIKIAGTLWHNPELRAEGIKLAEQRAKQNDSSTTSASPTWKATYEDPNDPLNPTITKMPPVTQPERQFLSQLVGWENAPSMKGLALRDALLILLGWVLTAIAVSLGAPFWFDILNKIINVRNAGKSPVEGAKTGEHQELAVETRPVKEQSK
jgi:hypothetical protein